MVWFDVVYAYLIWTGLMPSKLLCHLNSFHNSFSNVQKLKNYNAILPVIEESSRQIDVLKNNNVQILALPE